MSDNYEHARHRLLSLKNKLDRNKKELLNNNNIFKDCESEGVIEKVTEIPFAGKAFYLSHRVVFFKENDLFVQNPDS